jgi:hypothetical protein
MEILLVIQPPSSPAFDIKVSLLKRTSINDLLRKILEYEKDIDVQLLNEFDLFSPRKNDWLNKADSIIESGITSGDLLMIGRKGQGASLVGVAGLVDKKTKPLVDTNAHRLGVIWGPSSGQTYVIAEDSTIYSVDVAGYVTQKLEAQPIASFEIIKHGTMLSLKAISGDVKVNSQKVEAQVEVDLTRFDYIVTDHAIFVVLYNQEATETYTEDYEYVTLQLEEPPPVFKFKGLPLYLYLIAFFVLFGIASKYPNVLYAALLSLVLLFGQLILFKIKDKKGYDLAERKYQSKINRAKTELKINKNHEARFRRSILPDTASLRLDLKNYSKKPCIRYPQDVNFLLLRLGTSSQRALSNVRVAGNTDEVRELQEDFDKRSFVDNLPVGIKLWEAKSIGVKGEKFGNPLTSSLVLQLAAYHSHEDLNFTILVSKERLSSWDWVKWLPHLQQRPNGSGVPQVIIYESSEQVIDVFNDLKHNQSNGEDSEANDDLAEKVLLVDIVENISREAISSIFESDFYIINASDHLVEFCNVKVRITPNFMAELSLKDFDTFEIFREELFPSELIKSVRQLMHFDLQKADDANLLTIDNVVGEVTQRRWENSSNMIFSLTKHNQFVLDTHSHVMVLGPNYRNLDQTLSVAIASLLAHVSNDDLSLLVLCSFNSLLTVFGDVPHSVGIAYTEKPDLVDRAFNAIKTEYETRKTHGKADKSLVLVVDNIEKLIASEPRFEELLGKIINYGSMLNIHLFLGGLTVSPLFSLFNKDVLKVAVEQNEMISKIFFGKSIKEFADSQIQIALNGELIQSEIPHSYSNALFGKLSIEEFRIPSISPQRTSYSYGADKKYFTEFANELKTLGVAANESMWKKPLAEVIPFDLVHSALKFDQRSNEDIFGVVGIADRLDDRTHRPWMHSLVNEGNLLLMGSNKKELCISAEQYIRSLEYFLPDSIVKVWTNYGDLGVEHELIQDLDQVDESLAFINVIFLFDYHKEIEKDRLKNIIFAFTPYEEVPKTIMESSGTRCVFQMSSSSHLAFDGESYQDSIEKERFFGSAIVNGRYSMQVLALPVGNAKTSADGFANKADNSALSETIPEHLFNKYVEDHFAPLGMINAKNLFPIRPSPSSSIFGIFGNKESGIYDFVEVLESYKHTSVVVDPNWDKLEDEETGLTAEDFSETNDTIVFVSETLPQFIISELSDGLLFGPACAYIDKIFYKYELVWQTEPYGENDANRLKRGIFFKKLGAKVHLAVFQGFDY